MEALNTILQIPERCLVNKKITKAFFKRNFDLTSSEKGLLDDSVTIAAIDWLASISPDNSNINPFSDEYSLFEEVQVISVQTSGIDFERNQQRITELIQKHIPYPILLCIWHDEAFILNTCDKRINQNDNSRRSIEKKYYSEAISRPVLTEQQQAFLNSLNFAELDKTNLKSYYDSYTQRIISLQAAKLNGLFTLRTHERTQADIDNLEQIEAIEQEIQLLLNQVQKETQLNQKIALNIQIQERRELIEQLKTLITE